MMHKLLKFVKWNFRINSEKNYAFMTYTHVSFFWKNENQFDQLLISPIHISPIRLQTLSERQLQGLVDFKPNKLDLAA